MPVVLTHEWLFGAYLLFMAVGLLSTSGLIDANTLSYLAGRRRRTRR